MRTRFLATDYFSPSSATSSSGQALALEPPHFPLLPVPSLPPDPHFPLSLLFTAAADLPAASIADDDLESLPISSALSEFLAAVIPQALSVPAIPAADEGLDDFLYDRGVYCKGFSSRESVAFKIPKGLEEISHEKDEKGEGSKSVRSETSTATERWELLKELRFEVIEVDLLQALQRDVTSFGGEESGDGVILSLRVPDVKIHLFSYERQMKILCLDFDGCALCLCTVTTYKYARNEIMQDFIDIDTEMTTRYPTELADSIYQVEKISLKHNDEEDHSSARDSYCAEIASIDYGVIMPQLKISRHSWELDECSAKAEISNVFHNLVEHFDEAQVQHSAFSPTDFSRSTDMDMFALVCKDAPFADYQADKPTTVNAAVEMDLVRINDNILLERNSALYPLKPDGTCSDLPCSILLEEVQIIDFPPDNVFKMLVESDTAELNISDEIFNKDFDPARRFYESIVSSELAMVDDTFLSLPTPILTDDIAVRSMVPPIEDILHSLKPHPLSAADGIYLDWHLLLEGPCNREICCTYASMVEEVKTSHLSSELQVSCQQTSALGFDFLEDSQRSAKLQDEDKQNDIYVPAPLPHDPPAVVETAQKYRQESDTRGHSRINKLSSEKASSLFESTSQSNDLNFYLNVRSGTKRGTNDENICTLDIPPSKELSVSFSTRPKVDKLIEIHPVSLSDSILGLSKHIHICYTSALQESAYLRDSFSDGHGLSISKQKLLELITGEGSDVFYSHCKYEDKMELIILYALKQVAYYLCFFGLHAAHLYISNLIGSFENIPERLRNIHCFIGEARWKAEKQLFESHPSLFDIETILRSNTRIGQKILIVADRAFWLPLGQKLTSMKMTFVELGKGSAASYLDPVNKENSTTSVLGKLLKSDCILLDNKNIPASFPFNEFGIILEYGGPNKSSTLLSLAPKLDGLPPLHFLYVKVDGEDFPVALVEDNHTDQDLKSTLDTVLHTLQKDLQEKMNKMRIVDSLNFIPATNQLQGLQEKLCKDLTVDSTKDLPVDDRAHKLGNIDRRNIVDAHNLEPAAEQLHIQEILSKRTILGSKSLVPAVEKSSSTSSVSANAMKAPQDNLSATELPYSVKIDSITSGRLSVPEAVIVVNTGSHGKNMLFSRRSSYQQILSLEKGGMQVVERDVDLPVDLILSAAVCLVWCESKIFESSEFMTSTETSNVTNFIETIATNILMSISFSFSGCIMVFEGEPHFLSDVMESSDSLYAAAASLVMNLQLFFSHTPKSTDEIILSCIRNVTRLNKAPPDMPESESLAESFLTKFPSINPLSAHIMLSSGGSLVEFLSWSHERRIQAVGKYLLCPQSISLFSALCKFGELGESRSVMTECSSIDSGISSALLQSPRKRKKHASQAFVVRTSDPICPGPLNQLSGDCVEHDNVFSPPKSRKFSNMEATMPELPEVFMFDQSLNRGTEGVSSQQRKRGVDTIIGNQVMNDDFSNELTTNMRTYNGSASSMMDTYNFSWQSELGGKKPIESSFPTSRPSFSRTYSHPVFPTALEINDDPGDWSISGDAHHTWMGHAHGDIDATSCRNDVGSRYHEPSEDIMQNPTSSLAFLKQDFGCHATSHGSGWEIDYLRQMNEKRRARQERSRCNTSAMMSNSRMRDGSSKIVSPPPIESFRYRGDRDTPSRDRSPSIGSHRYGKGREGTKAQSHRARKDFKVQSSISHENRIEPYIDPTWTPIDKRARQKLSFATYGKEKQSKLIWRHKNSPGVGCGFRKRYREEGT